MVSEKKEVLQLIGPLQVEATSIKGILIVGLGSWMTNTPLSVGLGSWMTNTIILEMQGRWSRGRGIPNPQIYCHDGLGLGN
jgi:hypothetical protein